MDEPHGTGEPDGTGGAPNGGAHPALQSAAFVAVLQHLRGLALPCFPPVGVGSFDVLYASDREVVVWYSPAREEHRAGEVAIPCARLAAAWSALTLGEPLDEAALERCGEGVAGGRWLLALLAQLPGVRVQPDPLTLAWSPPPPAAANPPPPIPSDTPNPPPAKRRRPAVAAVNGAAPAPAKPRRPRAKPQPAAAPTSRRARHT